MKRLFPLLLALALLCAGCGKADPSPAPPAASTPPAVSLPETPEVPEDGDIETEFCYFVIKFGKLDNGTVSESFGERSARFRNPDGKTVDKINGKTAGDEF